MSPVRRMLCAAFLTALFFASAQCENCTVKKVSSGISRAVAFITCPLPDSAQDSKFCCYDQSENVECCNAVDRVHNLIQKYTPSILILLILCVGLLLVCCIVCICIPCYCLMSRRRPAYKDPSDNTNITTAVSLPNEHEEHIAPKKEVTHHLPPGAYPVYPQFMGMQPLKSTEVNC